MQTTNHATITRNYKLVEVKIVSLMLQLAAILKQFNELGSEQIKQLKKALTAINEEREHILKIKFRTLWSLIKIKLENTYGKSSTNFGSTVIIRSKLEGYDPEEQLRLPPLLTELTFPFTAHDPPELPEDISNMFANCEHVKSINFLALSSHYSDRYKLDNLFYNCKSLTFINLGLLKSLNIISAVNAFALITTIEPTELKDITIIAFGSVINALTSDNTSKFNSNGFVFDKDKLYTLTCNSSFNRGTYIISVN